MLPDSIFSMDGWCTREKAQRIYELVINHKPSQVVELGVFAGRSLIPMALGLVANQKGKITGIDPWCKNASTENYDEQDANHKWWNSLDHELIFNRFVASLTQHQVQDVTSYIRSTSRECHHQFATESIDILHQDGNHSETISCEEIELYADKVRSGGVWIMDDTNWETTRTAQALILTKGFELFEDHTEWKIYVKV